jgi:hypothetical protein
MDLDRPSVLTTSPIGFQSIQTPGGVDHQFRELFFHLISTGSKADLESRNWNSSSQLWETNSGPV